jgi:hypothetical protein
MTTPDFNPLATAAVPKTHNQDPFDTIAQEIADLYDECKNFCDGEPISSPEMADAISALSDRLHACGQRADELRTELKKPLDKQVKELQERFHPLIGNTTSGKGKVVLGKEACLSLLTPWRARVAAEKAAEAERIAAEAEAARLTAQEAIRASSGNLAEREAAEELLADAKRLERVAGRANKAATTGTGLRTTWTAELVDEGAALDWAWGRAKAEFLAVVQRNADEAVRAGVRQVPGFRVVEVKTASVGRV